MPRIDHYPTESETREDVRRLHVAHLTAYAFLNTKAPEPAIVTKTLAYKRDIHGKLPDCAPILSQLLTEMDEAVRDNLLYGNPKSRVARDLATWWEEHQEADEQRTWQKERSAQRKKEEDIRKKRAKAKLEKWLKANEKSLSELPKLLTFPVGSQVVFVAGDRICEIGELAFITGTSITSNGLRYSTTKGAWFAPSALRLVKLPTKASIDRVIDLGLSNEEEDEG